LDAVLVLARHCIYPFISFRSVKNSAPTQGALMLQLKLAMQWLFSPVASGCLIQDSGVRSQGAGGSKNLSGLAIIDPNILPTSWFNAVISACSLAEI
ncbi:MAG: hypothetical protein QF898_11055, partial [SAR202 cluster bacterium]|nr:hypothetical protein [SAR202 cluster bacterium]